MRRAALLVLLLAGCGGHGGDAALSPADRDEKACRAEAATKVNHENAKRALDWFASPVRRWSQISDATSACMLAKGHPQTGWCTPAELAQARQTGRVVVTAAGLQCVSEPKR